jgi:hypothetical protein
MADRPLIQPENDTRTPQQIEEDFWKNTREKDIERVPEKIVFALTPEEAEKCRFTKPDKNYRMAECTVHRKNFSHGVRMFPPHLWDWKDGKIYQKHKDEWIQWTADVKENLSRFDK